MTFDALLFHAQEANLRLTDRTKRKLLKVVKSTKLPPKNMTTLYIGQEKGHDPRIKLNEKSHDPINKLYRKSQKDI